MREYEETKKQIEEDADREILDIKNKYERRLRDEKEANMRLKGETGIMRKKVRYSLQYFIYLYGIFEALNVEVRIHVRFAVTPCVYLLAWYIIMFSTPEKHLLLKQLCDTNFCVTSSQQICFASVDLSSTPEKHLLHLPPGLLQK